MTRKRRKNVWNAGELNLTAMIDVAFQLLNFFIITAKPPSVTAHLSVLRPQPDVKVIKKDTEVPMLKITVFPKVYTINDKPMDLRGLEKVLGSLAATDPTQTVVIQCINAAPHRTLISLLDLCTKLKLTNLSVVSSGGY